MTLKERLGRLWRLWFPIELDRKYRAGIFYDCWMNGEKVQAWWASERRGAVSLNDGPTRGCVHVELRPVPGAHIPWWAWRVTLYFQELFEAGPYTVSTDENRWRWRVRG